MELCDGQRIRIESGMLRLQRILIVPTVFPTIHLSKKLGAMCATLQTLIPAPLPGKSFMQASHFQIAQDRRPQADVRRTSFQCHLPAWRGVSRPDTFPSPEVKNILHEDRSQIRELTSESSGAFPQKSLKFEATAPLLCQQKTNYKEHSDPKTFTFQTSSSADYVCPGAVQQPSTAGLAAMMENSSLPSGDPDKIRVPPSVYSSSYRGHNVKLHPYKKVTCAYLEAQTIKGDLQDDSQVHSIYKTDFEGRWNARPPLIIMSASSIVYGDPKKIRGHATEQASAYTAHDLNTWRGFSKDAATAEKCQSHVNLGDGVHRFCTTSNMQQIPDRTKKQAPAGLRQREPKALSIPGHPGRTPEWDAVSVSHLLHTQLDLKEGHTRVDRSQKSNSSVHFGETSLDSCYFTTTHTADYQPSKALPQAEVKSHAITESSVPLNLYQLSVPHHPPMEGSTLPEHNTSGDVHAQILRPTRTLQVELPVQPRTPRDTRKIHPWVPGRMKVGTVPSTDGRSPSECSVELNINAAHYPHPD